MSTRGGRPKVAKNYGCLTTRTDGRDTPILVGDLVDVYVLGASFTTAIRNVGDEASAAPQVELSAETVTEMYQTLQQHRVVQRVPCTCSGPGRRTLATIYATPHGLFVRCAPERRPSEHRTGDHNKRTWGPLRHGIEVVSCPRCSKRWAITLSPVALTRNPIREVHYARRVVPDVSA